MNRTLVLLNNGRCAGNMISETIGYRLYHEGFHERRFHVGGQEDLGFDDMCRRDEQIRLWYVMGHNVFGVHRLLKRDVEYFTTVRKSVERLHSKARQWSTNEDIAKYLHADWDFDNGITKRIAGIAAIGGDAVDMTSGATICSEGDFRADLETLARAQSNLTEVKFAVIQERLAESLAVLETLFGLPPMFCFRFNAFNRSTRALDMPVSLAEEIEERNWLDAQLYQHFNSVLDRELTARGEAFKVVVEARQLLFDAAAEARSEAEALAAVQDLVNGLFRDGRTDVAFEVLCVIVTNPSVNHVQRATIVQQVERMPPSEARDKIVAGFHKSPTLERVVE